MLTVPNGLPHIETHKSGKCKVMTMHLGCFLLYLLLWFSQGLVHMFCVYFLFLFLTALSISSTGKLNFRSLKMRLFGKLFPGWRFYENSVVNFACIQEIPCFFFFWCVRRFMEDTTEIVLASTCPSRVFFMRPNQRTSTLPLHLESPRSIFSYFIGFYISA